MSQTHSMVTFMKHMKCARRWITRQQLLTLRGQALAGDIAGAEKGLTTILKGNNQKRNVVVVHA